MSDVIKFPFLHYCGKNLINEKLILVGNSERIADSSVSL
jgi:hypothetical protein